MKSQIRRLAPHQNAKVLGVLMAVITVPMFSAMIIPMIFMTPEVNRSGNPIEFGFPYEMLIIMPFLYLVFTYLFVAVGCWLYNKLYKIIGGLEFEFNSDH